MKTPRDDLSSAGNDMYELKMALGGLSDRSEVLNSSLIFKQTTDLMDENDVIFSDEGSNDSFNIADIAADD